jgi:hypothetical protein
MNAQDMKVKENRLRRVAERRGFRLEKSRRRDPLAVDFGGYMLIDASTEAVVFGGSPVAYSASLDDIENRLAWPGFTVDPRLYEYIKEAVARGGAASALTIRWVLRQELERLGITEEAVRKAEDERGDGGDTVLGGGVSLPRGTDK